MDFLTAILFITGFVLLIVGAESLVRGASRLAVAAGISPLVVGLTVVAYGTSAPELAVTVQSTYNAQPDLAIGNVVGSNISNVLLVLGVSALVSPLVVSRQLVRFSLPIMLLAALALPLMGLDGNISRVDGLILVLGAILYTTYTVRRSRASTFESNSELMPDRSPARQMAMQLGLIVVGLALLLLGANWLVNGAVAAAEALGVSKLIIGLTVVAVGTSLPEVATSVVAGFQGQRDIAVGNVVGSNVFNILLVLGLTAIVSPDGVRVSQPAMRFDIPIMLGVSVTCLPVFFTGYLIRRWEGAMFLAYYAAYTLFLYLQATRHEALSPFSTVMLGFLIPLTAVTLIGLAWRAFHLERKLKPD